MRWFRRFIVAALLVLPVSASANVDEAALWQALRSGEAFAIMRHALAPGTGDPAAFELGDCSTQRNLSDAGRDQSRAIGDMIRANGIDEAAVYTSEWCRCRETAERLDLGSVTTLTALNSFFRNWSEREPRTDALRDWIAVNAPDSQGRPIVMVSHQVNISALTGTGTRSGEMVFVTRAADGALSVKGSVLLPPAQ